MYISVGRQGKTLHFCFRSAHTPITITVQLEEERERHCARSTIPFPTHFFGTLFSTVRLRASDGALRHGILSQTSWRLESRWQARDRLAFQRGIEDAGPSTEDVYARVRSRDRYLSLVRVASDRAISADRYDPLRFPPFSAAAARWFHFGSGAINCSAVPFTRLRTWCPCLVLSTILRG